MAKTEIKEKLQILSAQIGKAELMRSSGQYFSMNELIKMKREFGKLQRLYFKGGERE